ncbi:hypothetical protein BAUCODRAFT_403488 [Baudoinia panamericana UAMH 10762]|uniref:CFEM domain-containing protein n=1 Tax=Baudoinia panamericana (strain UAMH 10762) TaxID=717646 RepID=M2LTC1_BAUPA|nr:uncharacterized protein BAUCODRAFT_403488 [Baudoinia panamericana UAMH 10762]EMC97777.1 hypothetical protein BAUCODRAFT_403488 [Baudoinia panamericana UAMH 10762]
MRTFTLIAVASAAIVSAQTAAQNATAAALAAQIPACVIPCDDAAISSVGCGLTDYACHCAHGTQLSQIIPGCLANSTCSQSDLALFASIPPKICAALNSSANATSTTTATPVGTAVSSGRPSATANSTTTRTTFVSNTGSATATPSGPSASPSAPAQQHSGAGSLSPVISGLFGLLGAGLLFAAL